MTMPWLHNCPHSEDSWCLPCVASMGKQLEELTRAARAYVELRQPGIRSSMSEHKAWWDAQDTLKKVLNENEME